MNADLKAMDSFFDWIFDLKKSFDSYSPNTGYDLLIINRPNAEGFAVRVINPHPLPAELVLNDQDPVLNSKRQFFMALDGILQVIIASTPEYASLKKKLLDIKKLKV